jgi:two-component system OmpR family response regulator
MAVRVLVVEDHPRWAVLIRRGLEEEGYAVDLAPTGEEGLWLASANSYDAVVLDVVLPDIDGMEVCRRIRAGGTWTPVLMLTARDAIEDRARGLDLGADDYLTKPFSFVELLARLRALFRRGAGERASVLTVSDLTLDPAAKTVRHGKTPIELTAREFVLLEYFMRHPGEVLSRTRLREHVWDFAFEGDSNIIDVFVHRLRQKIDPRFGRRSIETVRGAGYRLRDEGSDGALD